MNTPKKVLVTQSQLKNYSGSEVLTLELVEYLANQGAQVTILTHFLGQPIQSDFEKLSGVSILLTTSPEADKIDLEEFDLMWVHHLTLTRGLIRQLSTANAPGLVFHHMSKSEPLEFPIIYDAEAVLADVVAFNSKETRDDLHEQGVAFDQKQTFVFGNPAPDGFMRPARTESRARPTRIAIVSNHPPEEIMLSAEDMRRQGVVVDCIGRVQGGVTQRVTPIVLHTYDLVISIGKTVQYSIVSGIPVYCYDRFGGPGFLTRENFERCQQKNFSGRGFNTKTRAEIVAEIMGQFETAAQEMADLHDKYADDLLLSRRFDALMAMLAENPKSTKKLTPVQENSLGSYSDVVRGLMVSYLRKDEKLNTTQAELRKLRLTSKEIALEAAKLETEIKALKNKKLLRLDNFLSGMAKRLGR